MEKSFPPKPSISEVTKYLKEWKKLEKYTSQERALNKLFLELLPGNSEITDILLKASCLNDFYSTNIFAIHSVAEHILSVKDLDKRLKAGDINLVSELEEVKIGDNKRYFYSFATKYCKFSSFKIKDLKDYRKFKGILLDFQRYYKLERFNLKEIDRYLWLLGKAYFSKKK